MFNTIKVVFARGVRQTKVIYERFKQTFAGIPSSKTRLSDPENSSITSSVDPSENTTTPSCISNPEQGTTNTDTQIKKEPEGTIDPNMEDDNVISQTENNGSKNDRNSTSGHDDQQIAEVETLNKGTESAVPDHIDSGEKTNDIVKLEPDGKHERQKDPDTNVADMETENPNPIDNTKQPPKIGGRRGIKKGDATTRDGAQGQEIENKLTLELVCQKELSGGTWQVFLASNDQDKIQSVHQNGQELVYNDEKWPVLNLSDNLEVSTNCGQKIVDLYCDEPLIFKLKANWKGVGRKVQKITKGHFIVMVPSQFEAKEAPPVASISCDDDNFTTHYIYFDPDEEDPLPEFRGLPPLATSKEINLIGDKIFDDSDEGQLYIGNSPKLNAQEGINWIRVGEEVSKHGWAENYHCENESLEEVLCDREGYFFLRIYENTEDYRCLIDSTSFRRSHLLRQITVDGKEYTKDTILLPELCGYSTAKIVLFDVNNKIIPPKNALNAMLDVLDSGEILVPRDQKADLVEIQITDGKSPVKIVIRLPRFWWRLKENDTQSDIWNDTPIRLTRNKFKYLAQRGAQLAVKTSRLHSIQVRLGDKNTRTYDRHKNKKSTPVNIPLSDFIDYQQIDQRIDKEVYLSIVVGEKSAPLIIIEPDPDPEIVSLSAEPMTVATGEETKLSWIVKDARDATITLTPNIGCVGDEGSIFVQLNQTTTFKLTVSDDNLEPITKTVTVNFVPHIPVNCLTTASVKSSINERPFRIGRGFSRGEAKEIGLTLVEVKCRSLPVDLRRRSTHSLNVNKLRKVIYG